MYASTPFQARSSGARRNNLYHQVGVETKLSGASPHQVVTMLFDGWLEAVAQARGAMRSGDIAQKGHAIGRAVRILDEGLRAGLDLRGGGPLAQDLDDLYAYLTMRLTLANLRHDESILDECQRLIKPLQEAWMSIGPAMSAAHALQRTA